MVRLQVPEIATSRLDMSLSGERFFFDYGFNSREQRWYLDIYNSNQELIVGGLKLIESVSPTVHLDLLQFNEGFLQVVQLDEADMPAGRDNLGINKAYDLQYVTFSELQV